MKRTITIFSLSMALLIPGCIQAQDHDRDDHHGHDRDHERRYYDRERKAYHQWNNGEDRAWHRYWQDQHHSHMDWNRANERQREAYWHWRHEHPDSVLFSVNVR